MKNNFIQMAASASHLVAYAIVSILKHIIEYCPMERQLFLWLVGVTFIFDGTIQIIVQRC